LFDEIADTFQNQLPEWYFTRSERDEDVIETLRRIGNAFNAKKRWILTPLETTASDLRLTTIHALNHWLRGTWHYLPISETSRKVHKRRVMRAIVLAVIAIGVPLLALLLWREVTQDKGLHGTHILLLFAGLWFSVVLLALSDPEGGGDIKSLLTILPFGKG
jgi:hypothetical protein